MRIFCIGKKTNNENILDSEENNDENILDWEENNDENILDREENNDENILDREEDQRCGIESCMGNKITHEHHKKMT